MDAADKFCVGAAVVVCGRFRADTGRLCLAGVVRAPSRQMALYDFEGRRRVARAYRVSTALGEFGIEEHQMRGQREGSDNPAHAWCVIPWNSPACYWKPPAYRGRVDNHS